MHKQTQSLLFMVWMVVCTPLWVGAEEPASAAATETTAPNQAPTAEQEAKAKNFATVELDRFIEQEQKAATANGKKIFRMAAPVSFDAKLKRQPEERQLEYVYTALQLAGVNPLPEVHHRMFVESVEGRIIPVYVEGNAVKKVNVGLKEEEKARFKGYHLYTYDKGPAILVVDFAAVP